MVSLEHEIFLVLLGLLVVLFAGIYLSGWILLTWMHSHQSTELTTIFQYLYHYGDHPVHGTKIKISAFIGFLAPFPLLILFIATPLVRKEENLCGRARFVKSPELQKAGFFKSTENSIVVDKQGNQYPLYNGQQFALLAAPIRSGKGVGIVIPNLFSYRGPMVVLDIKQENFGLTSSFREECRQKVYLFSPSAGGQCTYRWNPLSYVSKSPSFRISDLSSTANILYPTGENLKDRLQLNQAQNAFMALALLLLNKRKQNGSTLYSIGALYCLSNGDGRDLRGYFREISEAPFVSKQCKSAFVEVLGQPEETLGNIMATFREPLFFWLSPIADMATSVDDFLLTDARRQKVTIYIGIQSNKLAEARLIINPLSSQLINLSTKKLPQSNKELWYQCLLLMDEFTSIGTIDIIAKSVSYVAGCSIRLFSIIQSLTQLGSVCGGEVSRIMVTNYILQALYIPREQQDAADHSGMLGYTSVKESNVIRGREKSVSIGDGRRALMFPQELRTMPENKEIFVYEGPSHPVMCEKIRCYKDSSFTKRLQGKIRVPRLNVSAQLYNFYRIFRAV